MGRGIKHRLKPARTLINGLSMYPELVDQIEPSHKANHQRVKTKQDLRQSNNKQSRDRSSPRLAQGCRQIIKIRRMMHHMIGPKPAHPVHSTVLPIIDKIIQHEQACKAPDAKPDRTNPRMLIDPERGIIYHISKQGSAHRTTRSHQDGCPRIFCLIGSSQMLLTHPPPFQPDKQNKGRYRQQGRIRKVRHRLASIWRESGLAKPCPSVTLDDAPQTSPNIPKWHPPNTYRCTRNTHEHAHIRHNQTRH